MLTQERLKEVLDYEPETGVFTWKVRPSNRVKVGAAAGCIDSNGYVVIRIDGCLYRNHRLAWLYAYGAWPDAEVDHGDQDRGNNSFSNLRAGSHKQNAENTGVRSDNKSGYKGVSWCVAAGKWRAQIRHNQQTIHLGVFADPEDASVAYETARDCLFTHHKRRV